MSFFSEKLQGIAHPTLLLDQQKMQKNLNRILANGEGKIIRPHAKTHQSADLGLFLKEEGIQQITVSSIAMAAYFKAHGWTDILIAFPVNLRAFWDVNALAKDIKLHLTIEDAEVLRSLAKHLHHPVGIYIKLAAGNNRAGLLLDGQDAQIDAILEVIESTDNLSFTGLLGHAGQTYKDRSKEDIQRTWQTAYDAVKQVVDRYRHRYPNLIWSMGDTPSSSQVSDHQEIDELRAGNFIFYDLMQAQIGSCSKSDIAVCMACPVVAVHPERQEFILHGGAVHFSKDFILDESGDRIYGELVQWTDMGWEPLDDPIYLRRLSQEHGIGKASTEQLAQIKPGDLLGFLPVHSCHTANLMKGYMLVEGGWWDMMPPNYLRLDKA